jgi:hypothetical protein
MARAVSLQATMMIFILGEPPVEIRMDKTL